MGSSLCGPIGLRGNARLDSDLAGSATSRLVRRIGQYELLRKIGAGGMAQVWMGRRAAMEGVTKAVAIKLLGSDHADDPRYHEMFLAEAKLTMLLSHSNVVQTFDVGQDGDQSYMVMEWVDGLNLSQLAALMRERGVPFPLPVAAFVTGEVLRALAYAHTVTHAGAPLGVIHRDVSPQNVLISVSGEVKLADFGVARLAQEETSGLHVKGKLRYMAPEQLEGQSKAATVDLYAVGAMLHELMDGRKFREATDEMHLYGKVMSGEVPVLANTDVARELDQLRLGLLAPDPSQRIQSADHALELLMRWPGYRNTDRELAKLCRSFMGVKAPRSGIHERASTSPSGITASVEATVTSPHRSQSQSIGNVGSGPLPTATGSVSELELAQTQAATLRPGAAPAERRGPKPLLIFAVAFIIAGALGGAIAWYVLSQRGAGETESDAAVARAEGSGADETSQGETSKGETGAEPSDSEPSALTGESPDPADSAAAEPAGEPAPEPVADAGSTQDPIKKKGGGGRPKGGGQKTPDTGGTSGEPQPEPTDLPDALPPPPKDDDGPKEVKKVGKASVQLKTGDFRFVYVKLAGQSHALEPISSTKIKAGKHKLYMRQSPDESWKLVKTVEFEPNASYVIRMRKPSGADVTKK